MLERQMGINTTDKFSNDRSMTLNATILLDECAFFSNHVYDDSQPLPPGWEILYSCEDATGYKGNIYVKDLLTHFAKVVIAHRGTVPSNMGDMLNNIDYVLGKVPSQCSSMFYYMGQKGFGKLFSIYDNDPTFPKNDDPTNPHTEENPKLKYISYVSTGHSLGGLLSDCFTALNQANFVSVTFENPGSRQLAHNVLAEMLRLPEPNIAQILGKMQSLCFAYQGGVNAINTCQQQVGRTFRFQKLDYLYTVNSLGLMTFPPSHSFASNFTYLVDYTLDQHSMKKILGYARNNHGIEEMMNPVGIHAGYIEYVNPQNKVYWKGYLSTIWESDSVMAAALRLKYENEEAFNTHAFQQLTLIYEELLKNQTNTVLLSSVPEQEKMFYPQFSLFNSWKGKTDEQIINDFVLIDKDAPVQEISPNCTIM